VVNPGAVFTGLVAGGSGSNTMELAQGGSPGSIGGLGTTFRHFDTLAIDNSANWTLNGANTVGTVANNGTLAIASSGSLDVTVAAAPSTGLFTLNGSASLEIASAVGGGNQISFLAPSRLIVDQAAQFGSGVGQPTYSGPLLENFDAGDGILMKDLVPTGLTLDYSAATGILQIGSGGASVGTLLFQDSSLGAGTFQVSDDGAGHALISHA